MSVRRFLLVVLALLLTASSAWADCQFGTSGSSPTSVVGLFPLNGQTVSVTATTAVGFTVPTTTPSGVGSERVQSVLMAVVTVTGGSINTWDNGLTPTTSTTAGGMPFGACTGCAITFNVCGPTPVTRFRMISQSGTATAVISYYGAAPLAP